MENTKKALTPPRTWLLIGLHIATAAALSGLLLYLLSRSRGSFGSGGVTFMDVLLLMLVAGGLGGILCNFRGLFAHLRDEHYFPAELEIPYYVRAVTGALCGLIVYFVASLLVVSITLEAVVDNITFQGMISYIALALLAGFGSQEFTERLKATAGTLFGQKEQKDKMDKLKELHRLFADKVLTEEEFTAEKKKLLDKD